jgi:hypothetical protein
MVTTGLEVMCYVLGEEGLAAPRASRDDVHAGGVGTYCLENGVLFFGKSC